MKLDELYPYWAGAHDALLGALQTLSAQQLSDRPHPGAPSIRQLALELLQNERFWIAELVAGYAVERVKPGDFKTGPALAEALNAQREITQQVLSPLSAAGLKAVRTVPADAVPGYPEANRPVAWIFWHVMERELMAWGQIHRRLEEQRASKQQIVKAKE